MNRVVVLIRSISIFGATKCSNDTPRHTVACYFDPTSSNFHYSGEIWQLNACLAKSSNSKWRIDFVVFIVDMILQHCSPAQNLRYAFHGAGVLDASRWRSGGISICSEGARLCVHETTFDGLRPAQFHFSLLVATSFSTMTSTLRSTFCLSRSSEARYCMLLAGKNLRP